MSDNYELEKLLNAVYYANKFSYYFLKTGWILAIITFLVLIISNAIGYKYLNLFILFPIVIPLAFHFAFNETYERRFNNYDNQLRVYDEFSEYAPYLSLKLFGRESERFANDARKDEIVYFTWFALKKCVLFLVIALPISMLPAYLIFRL